MEDDPRFEIDNPAIKELMRDLGAKLGKALPKGWGFALEIFEFSGDSFFYISNADRADMIKALREFIRREGGN